MITLFKTIWFNICVQYHYRRYWLRHYCIVCPKTRALTYDRRSHINRRIRSADRILFRYYLIHRWLDRKRVPDARPTEVVGYLIDWVRINGYRGLTNLRLPDPASLRV